MVFICMIAVLHTSVVSALPDTIDHLGLNLSVNGLISMAGMSITKKVIIIIVACCYYYYNYYDDIIIMVIIIIIIKIN